MKESEDKNWKEEILKDFEKPTHTGFNDEVMDLIQDLEKKPAMKPAPLISAQQWFFTALIASIIVLIGVFVQYQIQLDFGYIEMYSAKMLEWINSNMQIIWSLFALVAVFFIFSLMNRKGNLIKIRP